MNRPIDPSPATPPDAAPRGLPFKLAALSLTLLSALAGLAAYQLKPRPESKPVEPAVKEDPFARLFRGWNKPDLVVILSAQQHGYLKPCGCSFPQVGGLERRYNFMQMLKSHGWPVVGVDLGDVPQKRGPANLANLQGLIKYRYSMKALKEMGYLAVGVGEYEGALSLARIEGEWAASFGQPAVLVANLKEADTNFPFLKPLEIQTIAGTGLKVGVTNIIGPKVAKQINDPAVKFNDTVPVLDAIVKQMQTQKVDLPILLYHGVATGRAEAVKCAQAYPQFPVILCLSEEDEPPVNPIAVDHPGPNTRNYVFRLGHKGKHIGVLGVYRNGPALSFKYQLVEMSIDYLTPKGQEDKNPIARMLEEYQRELKNRNALKEYGQTKHILQAMDPVPGLRNPEDGVPRYVGSKACQKCHDEAYAIWEVTPHSHAYKTLEEARHPSLSQYDAECVVCHTVGFGSVSGFTDEIQTEKLKNVGCESCHGPGSLHAKNPENLEWRARMNQPWRAEREKGNMAEKNGKIEKFCVSCHDIDNDVTWVHNNKKDPFLDKWIGKKIIHNKPKDKE
jgi:hypothetical protein